MRPSLFWAASLAAACHVNEPADRDPDAGAADAHVRQQRFEMDVHGAGPAIYLAPLSVDPEALLLEMRARGISRLYGVAFRVEYDPLVLGEFQFERVAFWPADPDGLVAARVARDGYAICAATLSGAHEGLDVDDAVIGLVRFARRSPEDTRVRFETGTSGVVDAAGRRVEPVQWSAGGLVTR